VYLGGLVYSVGALLLRDGIGLKGCERSVHCLGLSLCTDTRTFLCLIARLVNGALADP
jgi:hypothetical protein